MIEGKNSLTNSIDPEDSQTQVLNLRRQLADLEAQNRAMWILLAEVSRKLQTSSTSIKAAVSSLLAYDLFWDGSTQHEFLETIDGSVDQGANLITLLTLVSRSQANGLDLMPEPHALQEILSTVLDTISVTAPEFRFDVVFPAEGNPVFVDYDYLAVGLRLLFEVLIEYGRASPQVELRIIEAQDCWYLDVVDIRMSFAEVIDLLRQGRIDDLIVADHISSENVLKLLTASRIFHRHDMRLEVQEGEDGGEMGLHLTIPTVQVRW